MSPGGSGSPGCDIESCPSAQSCHHRARVLGKWAWGVSALQLGNFWAEMCSTNLFESPSDRDSC